MEVYATGHTNKHNAVFMYVPMYPLDRPALDDLTFPKPFRTHTYHPMYTDGDGSIPVGTCRAYRAYLVVHYLLTQLPHVTSPGRSAHLFLLCPSPPSTASPDRLVLPCLASPCPVLPRPALPWLPTYTSLINARVALPRHLPT